MGISGRSIFSLSGWVLIVAYLVIVFFGKTCNGGNLCTPSSCGNIHNISYPFRLLQDPKHCGESQFTLSCDNNITVLDLPSSRQKFYVQAINYDNQTLRVVDPGLIHSNNCSSVPRDSSITSDIFGFKSPYSAWLTTVCFFKCPNRMINSSRYVDTAPCINSQPKTYGYVTVGDLAAGELEEGCSLEWISWVSWSLSCGDYNNASYKYMDIHNAMVHGFEVEYSLDYLSCGSSWHIYSKCFPHTISGFFRLLWEWNRRFFVSPRHHVYIAHGPNVNDVILNFNQRWAPLAGIGLIILIKFIFGTPFVMALLIHKW